MSLFSKKESEQGREQESRGSAGARAYGIAETIRLMRGLPVDQNVELVVRVIRGTLESMDVHLPNIIEDAAAKEKTLQERMETLRGEIADLSKQIETRREEIARLQSELSETTTVKDRLQLAQKLAGVATPPSKTPSPSSVPPPLKKPQQGKPAELHDEPK